MNLIFLLLLSLNIFAANVDECKVAIMDFNKSHANSEIRVKKFVNGNGVSFVVSIKEHKNDIRENNEFSAVVRTCLSAGFEPFINFTEWGSTKSVRSCPITDRNTIAMSCSKDSTELKNVVQVELK